eukprot:9480595-Pyramimonas_sp.AAC.2
MLDEERGDGRGMRGRRDEERRKGKEGGSDRNALPKTGPSRPGAQQAKEGGGRRDEMGTGRGKGRDRDWKRGKREEGEREEARGSEE